MENREVLSFLCSYDESNPDNMILDSGRVARQDCYCDNCFTGRDKLALEILKLKGNI